MPSAATFRDLALAHIGLQNVALLQTNASAAMMRAFNKALQEIYSAERQETIGVQLRAPITTITLQLTNGATTITAQSGLQDYMAGCSIQISGDTRQNRLEKSTGTWALSAPYQGATAAGIPATVYGDVVNLDATVKQIYPPYLIDNQYRVEPLDSRAALLDVRSAFDGVERATTVKTTRRPEFLILDDSLTATAAPAIRLEFDSFPDANYVLQAEALLSAPRIDAWNDTREYFMPGNEDESILYPWALYNFRTWPQFIKDPMTLQQIAQDYATAKTTWETRTRGFTHTHVSLDT